MRVDTDIAVTGKMFCASHHAFILQAFHILCPKQRYLIFILTKAAIVDNRIRRIIVDIYDRGKIYLYAESLALSANSPAKLVYEPCIRSCAYHHLAWKIYHTVES